MGRLIILVIVFFSCSHLKAQTLPQEVTPPEDTAVSLLSPRKIQGVYTDFTVDELGNIFLVINNTQLKKLDRNGDSVAVFNDVKRYGHIHSIDAANPFKILVFYKSTATIVVLDRLLGIKQVIDLRKNNILQARSVKVSYDNNIWVFDELENKIRKIDDNGKLLSESADLRNVFSETPSFEAIYDDSRSLFLYDSTKGWFVFDYYGGFRKKYPYTGWKDVQVDNELLMGRDEMNFYLASTSSMKFVSLKSRISFDAVIKVVRSKTGFFFLFKDRLEIYDAI